MKCIIPCAGLSSRMEYVPKHLIQIQGKPLISHVIDRWKDVVDNFIFILRPDMTYMWEFLPSNSAVVFQTPSRGLAHAVYQAAPYVDDKFVLVLGDCLLGKGAFEEKPLSLGIGVTGETKYEISKNFAVCTNGNRITGLYEKPQEPHSYNLCGMGVYFLDPTVFDYIEHVKVKPGGGDLTAVLHAMIEDGVNISPVFFHGRYVNVSGPEDIKIAEEILK